MTLRPAPRMNSAPPAQPVASAGALAGFIQMYGGAVAPAGWLLCDGASYAVAAQPALFAVLGYAFGGAGANFNVPDLRGRSPVGEGAGAGLTPRALGASGGEENHALTDAENGTHLHTLTAWDAAKDHEHTQPAQIPGVPGDVAAKPRPAGGFTDTPTSLAGAGAPHNTMHPFQVVNFIIKT